LSVPPYDFLSIAAALRGPLLAALDPYKGNSDARRETAVVEGTDRVRQDIEIFDETSEGGVELVPGRAPDDRPGGLQARRVRRRVLQTVEED